MVLSDLPPPDSGTPLNYHRRSSLEDGPPDERQRALNALQAGRDLPPAFTGPQTPQPPDSVQAPLSTRRSRPISMLSYNTLLSNPGTPTPLGGIPALGSRQSPSVAPVTKRTWTVIVTPPPLLPHSPPPPHVSGFAHGYGASGRFGSGILVPLQPTLNLQMASIAREFSLPSTGGLTLHLCILPVTELAQPGPRVTEDSWSVLFSWAFDDSNSTGSSGLLSSTGLPIAARIEFDIDLRKARWFDAWASAAQSNGSKRHSLRPQHTMQLSMSSNPGRAGKSPNSGPLSAGSSTSGHKPGPMDITQPEKTNSDRQLTQEPIAEGDCDEQATQASAKFNKTFESLRSGSMSSIRLQNERKRIEAVEEAERERLRRLAEAVESASEQPQTLDSIDGRQGSLSSEAQSRCTQEAIWEDEREDVSETEVTLDQENSRTETARDLDANTVQSAPTDTSPDLESERCGDEPDNDRQQQLERERIADLERLEANRKLKAERVVEAQRLEAQRKLVEERAAEEQRLEEERKVEAERVAESERLEDEQKLEEERAAEVKRLEGERKLKQERLAESERLEQERATEAQRKLKEERVAEVKRLDAELKVEQECAAKAERLEAERQLQEERAAEAEGLEAERKSQEKSVAEAELKVEAEPAAEAQISEAEPQLEEERTADVHTLEVEPRLEDEPASELETLELERKQQEVEQELTTGLEQVEPVKSHSVQPEQAAELEKVHTEDRQSKYEQAGQIIENAIEQELKPEQDVSKAQDKKQELGNDPSNKSVLECAVSASPKSEIEVPDTNSTINTTVSEREATKSQTQSKKSSFSLSFGNVVGRFTGDQELARRRAAAEKEEEEARKLMEEMNRLVNQQASLKEPHDDIDPINPEPAKEASLERMHVMELARSFDAEAVSSSGSAQSSLNLLSRTPLHSPKSSMLALDTAPPVAATAQRSSTTQDSTAPLLYTYPSSAALAADLAQHVVRLQNESLERHQKFVVAISGGGISEILADGLLKHPDVKWDQWKVFFADERIVPLDHPDSNFTSVMHDLFSKVPIDRSQVVSIMSLPPDEMDLSEMAPVVASIYEAQILDELVPGPPGITLPQFDLVLLGMGEDGHTCSLFPSHKLLTEEGIVSWLNDSPEPPLYRITLTLPVLNAARNTVFACTGSGKSKMLAAVLEGERSETRPASLVQMADQKVAWFVDEKAAELSTYKRSTWSGTIITPAETKDGNAKASDILTVSRGADMNEEAIGQTGALIADTSESKSIEASKSLDDELDQGTMTVPEQAQVPTQSSQVSCEAITSVRRDCYPFNLIIYPAFYPHVGSGLYPAIDGSFVFEGLFLTGVTSQQVVTAETRAIDEQQRDSQSCETLEDHTRLASVRDSFDLNLSSPGTLAFKQISAATRLTLKSPDIVSKSSESLKDTSENRSQLTETTGGVRNHSGYPYSLQVYPPVYPHFQESIYPQACGESLINLNVSNQNRPQELSSDPIEPNTRSSSPKSPKSNMGTIFSFNDRGRDGTSDLGVRNRLHHSTTHSETHASPESSAGDLLLDDDLMTGLISVHSLMNENDLQDKTIDHHNLGLSSGSSESTNPEENFEDGLVNNEGVRQPLGVRSQFYYPFNLQIYPAVYPHVEQSLYCAPAPDGLPRSNLIKCSRDLLKQQVDSSTMDEAAPSLPSLVAEEISMEEQAKMKTLLLAPAPTTLPSVASFTNFFGLKFGSSTETVDKVTVTDNITSNLTKVTNGPIETESEISRDIELTLDRSSPSENNPIVGVADECTKEIPKSPVVIQPATLAEPFHSSDSPQRPELTRKFSPSMPYTQLTRRHDQDAAAQDLFGFGFSSSASTLKPTFFGEQIEDEETAEELRGDKDGSDQTLRQTVALFPEPDESTLIEKIDVKDKDSVTAPDAASRDPPDEFPTSLTHETEIESPAAPSTELESPQNEASPSTNKHDSPTVAIGPNSDIQSQVPINTDETVAQHELIVERTLRDNLSFDCSKFDAESAFKPESGEATDVGQVYLTDHHEIAQDCGSFSQPALNDHPKCPCDENSLPSSAQTSDSPDPHSPKETLNHIPGPLDLQPTRMRSLTEMDSIDMEIEPFSPDRLASASLTDRLQVDQAEFKGIDAQFPSYRSQPSLDCASLQQVIQVDEQTRQVSLQDASEISPTISKYHRTERLDEIHSNEDLPRVLNNTGSNSRALPATASLNVDTVKLEELRERDSLEKPAELVSALTIPSAYSQEDPDSNGTDSLVPIGSNTSGENIQSSTIVVDSSVGVVQATTSDQTGQVPTGSLDTTSYLPDHPRYVDDEVETRQSSHPHSPEGSRSSHENTPSRKSSENILPAGIDQILSPTSDLPHQSSDDENDKTLLSLDLEKTLIDESSSVPLEHVKSRSKATSPTSSTSSPIYAVSTDIAGQESIPKRLPVTPDHRASMNLSHRLGLVRTSVVESSPLNVRTDTSSVNIVVGHEPGADEDAETPSDHSSSNVPHEFDLSRLQELTGQPLPTASSLGSPADRSVGWESVPKLSAEPNSVPSQPETSNVTKDLISTPATIESSSLDVPPPPPPILFALSDQAEISEALGQFVFEAQEAALQRHGTFQIALTGSGLPQILSDGIVMDERIQWDRWEFFLVEEAIAPLGSAQSTFSSLSESILSRVPIPAGQIHAIADLSQADIDEATAVAEGLDSMTDSLADDYENELLACFPEANHETGQPPKFDLILVTLGEDGSIGSLYPLHPLLGESNWFVAWLGDAPEPPLHRITLTLPVLNAARQLAVVAMGKRVAAIMADALERTVQSDVPMEEDRENPAALIKADKRPIVWFADSEAASITDYPRSAFWDE